MLFFVQMCEIMLLHVTQITKNAQRNLLQYLHKSELGYHPLSLLFLNENFWKVKMMYLLQLHFYAEQMKDKSFVCIPQSALETVRSIECGQFA